MNAAGVFSRFNKILMVGFVLNRFIIIIISIDNSASVIL